MKNNVPGHQYELSNFENKDQQGQILQFIHKEPKEEGSTELITISDGTTNEEILEAHHAQTKLLQDYASGVEIKIEIIMVHAQDHLMTTMTLLEVAKEMLVLHRKVG